MLEDESKEVDIEAMNAEVEALEAEERSIKDEIAQVEERAKAEAAEKRKIAEEINAGNIAGKEEPIKEEKRSMENVFETKEYRSAYLKQLMGKELTVEERGLVTASAVVPTQTVNSIIEKLEQTSILYPYISKSNIPGNLTLPVEGDKNDASWVAMGTASTDSADTFSSVSLSAYKLIKTVEIGADVAAMSIDAFESFLVNALAKKMAKAVDYAILNGTGSSQATGLLKSGEIDNTGTFTRAGMTFADLLAIIEDLPSSEYRRNAKFVMPSALYFNDVVSALAGKGIGVDVQNALQFKILGYDVILDDYMTADTLIFGDLSYYHWNWAQDVAIESDMSVAFKTGSTVYRAMALADGKPTLKAAFNKYTRAAS